MKKENFIVHPYYEGGNAAMEKRIAESLKYPENALIHHAEGTVSIKYNIDHKGHVLKKKGATYNPLLQRKILTQLIFIEGNDTEQVAWALKQPRSKIVLVNGSPIDLEEKHQVPLYFDQRGFLCRKFGISAFPARVFQQDHVLRCEEIALAFRGLAKS